MSIFYQTDIGMKRVGNEDSLNVAYNKTKQPLLILCDGVGGQQFGEVASQMTVNYLTKEWEQLEYIGQKQIGDWLDKTINHVNGNIYGQSIQFADLKGMATTIVCACIIENQLNVAHVGDSRAYVFRFPQLKQITRDHSLVNYLIDMNEITSDDAINHPMKNVITRAIGSDHFVNVELTYVTLQDDDVVLLCSDGLTDMIDDDSIAKILNQSVGVEEMGQNLIRLANFKGGKDNISVILQKIKFKGGGK